MGRWSRRLAPLLVKFAAVGERDAVLDIGSGTGALAFAVAEAVPSAHVTGVDPSSAYVRYAEARTPGDRVWLADVRRASRRDVHADGSRMGA
jgi:ubiquinone/menaquinone biosynthesis C-methylase UbiE